MSLSGLLQQFVTDMAHTTWYEYLAVFAGIASVWYSRAENILVYPVGLINTIIYIFIRQYFCSLKLIDLTMNFN